MWRYSQASRQIREHYEIGVLGKLEHRLTHLKADAVYPIRQFDNNDDLFQFFHAIMNGRIKLEDAPTYKLGEETDRGERIETIAEIHARISRGRYGRRRR